MLLGKNIDEIDGDTIKSLIEGKVPESVHLEFKRETYKKDNEGKKEFLKDISAFANTLGGHLIIGIGENDGVAASVESISENVDKELQRLESMARTGIEPTILGLCMEPIDIDDKNVIVIHIPRSFNPPHRVISKGINKYYGRHSSGVHELSLEELRQSFGERRSIEERAKSFVGQRFLSIQADDGIMPLLAEDGALVLHLVPLPDFGAERRIDPVKIKELHLPNSSRINLDGCCTYSPDNPCIEYIQIFRNGVIEAVSASAFKREEKGRFFGGRHLSEDLIRTLNKYMERLCILEITPPILLQISMMRVKGIKLYGVDTFVGSNPPYGRDVLHLPASVIDKFRKDENYQSVIAEQMHFLWNAFGFERCDLFNENDEWDPPRR